MRWGIVVAAALTIATVDAADAQSVANTLAKFGVIGTWAADCTQPASSSNYLTVYAIKGSGEVSRTYYDKPGHVFNNYKVVSASRLAANMLAYTQVWDFEGTPANPVGNRVNVVLNMVGDKFQIVLSQGSDGSYFVKDRKYPSSGNESPWQSHCQKK